MYRIKEIIDACVAVSANITKISLLLAIILIAVYKSAESALLLLTIYVLNSQIIS